MNKLYFGDNLEIIRQYIQTDSVDLIYLDPPFNSQAQYNILFRSPEADKAAAQAGAFRDTWSWGEEAERSYAEIMRLGGAASKLLDALRNALGESDTMAYLSMMTVRLIELRRVLKPTGSLYLHCDPVSSHYLKILLDATFGTRLFHNEIIWKRTSSHGNVSANYGDVTDTIFFYSKGDNPRWNKPFIPLSEKHVEAKYTIVDKDGRKFTTRDIRNPGYRPNLIYDYKGFKPHPNGWSFTKEKMEQYDREGRLYFPKNPEGRIRLKIYLDESQGRPLQNLWDDIPPINSQAQERLGSVSV